MLRILHYKLFWLSGILFLLFSLNTSADTLPGTSCVALDDNPHRVPLGQQLRYFRDQSTTLTIENILDKEPNWQQSHENTPNFGYDAAAYWINFSLCGEIMNESELILQLGYPLIDSIDLYVVSNQQILHQEHAGDLLLYSERSIPHRLFLFILLTYDLDQMQVYMRVKTSSSVQLPLTLYTSRGFFIADQKSSILQGLYFGTILAMLLYNGFLFYSLRDPSYLYYVLYLGAYMGFQATLQGFFQQFFFESVWLQNNAILFFGFLSIFLAFRFALSFLNLYDSNPKVSLWLKNMSYVAFISIPLSWSVTYLTAIQMMLTLAVLGSVLLLYSGLTLWREGDSAARIYTIAWCTILIAFFLAAFNKIGMIPRNFFTEDIMQFGELFQVMLLAVALGARINYERRRREIAQQNLLAMQQNLTATLEEKVNDRTRELNHTLKQLEAANAELDKISRIDGLTQVGNRRFFDDEFKREYLSAIRHRHPLALILLDIDHFKRLNDNFGHQMGDQVLKDVAKLISTVAKRPDDKVFRYGGEEFVVLLVNTSAEGAQMIAEEIRIETENYRFRLEDTEIKTTISAGVSFLNDCDDLIEQEQLLKMADQALYKAKELGRNQVSVAEIKTDK